MAGRACKVCNHEKIDEINRDLAAGQSYSAVSAKYGGLSCDSIGRHARGHLPEAMKQAAETTKAEHGESLFDEIQSLKNRVSKLMDVAEHNKDLRGAAAAAKELRQCLELIGKITGEYPNEKILHLVMPVMDNIVNILRSELYQYPELLTRIQHRLLAEAGGETAIPVITIEGGVNHVTGPDVKDIV